MNALIEHLGARFKQLPPLLQRAHQGAIRLSGPVTVVRGRGLAWLLDMPEAGAAVPLVVKGRLVHQLKHVSLFGFALPQALAPQLVAFEAEDNQRYLFQVEVR